MQWSLEHPDATAEELLEALPWSGSQGPDFPTGALIVGRAGIEDAYRTGRGSVRMRAVVDIEEDATGRTCLVVTELPYHGQPGQPGAEDRRAGQAAASSPASPTSATTSSARTGMRLVIVLKRDAVSRRSC